MGISFFTFAWYVQDNFPSSALDRTNTVAARPLPCGKGERPGDRYAVAFAALLRNAIRSALIVSASVVGMPCGKSL